MKLGKKEKILLVHLTGNQYSVLGMWVYSGDFKEQKASLTKKGLIVNKAFHHYKITTKGILELLKFHKINIKLIKFFYKNMENSEEKGSVLKYLTLNYEP